jgi:hypothetical protein
MTPNASRLLETVDEMLLDAGQAHADELRAALLSLGTFASLQAPVPNAELAALLAGPGDQLSRQRRLRSHRPAVVGLAVLTGMGLGVSGVAATAPGQGQLSSPSIQHLLQDWVPAWNIAGGVPSASPAAGLSPDPHGVALQEAAAAAGPAPAKSRSAQPEAEATRAEKARRTDDGGAVDRQAASAPGLAAQGAKQSADEAQGDADRQPEQAQRQDAGTRAGKPDPGACWLNKFSR